MSSELPTPPPSQEGGKPSRFPGEQSFPKWAMWLVLGVLVAFLFLPLLKPSSAKSITYGDFLDKLKQNEVKVTQDGPQFNNTSGEITGELNDGTKFTAAGPLKPTDADIRWMTDKQVKFVT